MGSLCSKAAATRGWVVEACIALLLAACGGDDSSTAAPTELPQTLAVTAPATQQALGTPASFSSNAADPSRTLSYQWDFGDGTTSSLASPTHAYAKPGLYTVRLTLTNEAGSSRSATATVAAADLAIVQGKVCSGADGTGWCWQRPLPQGNPINDYAFVDGTHGWAVGAGGTLLVTADAGATWQPQVSGTTLDLTQAVFPSARAGWIAATHGELLRTSDGGATWQQVSFGQDRTVSTLGAADADTAWVTTDGGGVAYVTSDGGAHWKRIAPSSGASRLVLAGSSDIWALPYFGTSTLRHSVDAGVTWSDVTLPPVEAGLTRYFTDFQLADARHALVVASESGYSSSTQTYISRAVAWRTVDGGASWQPVGTPPEVTYSGATYYGFTYRLADAGTLFAFSSFPGLLLRSTDGGSSWQAVGLPALTNAYVVSIRPDSAQRLTVRDSSGRLWLTADGGAHWTEASAGGLAAPQVSSVWFFDSREGLAIGSDGGSIRTTDGGLTWVTTTPSGVYGWRRAQFLPDGSVGWVISDSGTIFRSTDRGRTWLAPVPQTSTALYSVTDVYFIDAQHGWAVSPYPYSAGSDPAAIYGSSDGGLSWQAVAGTGTFDGLVSLRFADALHGVAVGPAGIAMVTSDGGRTWSPRPTGIDRNLSRVTFADTQTAIAVGNDGFIVRSTDQGRTWSRSLSPTTSSLNDVRFLSATIGYAVGDAGTLLVTRDGGSSWTLADTGARVGLQAVFFLDERTGWIAGNNGSILATVSGGS